MIDVNEVIAIHTHLIKTYGGLDGIRDDKGLDSALKRPFQTFDGNDLYPAIEGKAAALLESLLINHPFVDGNIGRG